MARQNRIGSMALILAFSVAACSSVPKKVALPAAAVDRSDGISRDEAVSLAQEYMVAQGKDKQVKSLTPFEVEEAQYLCTLNELSCYADSFNVPEAVNSRKVKSWRVAFKSLEGAAPFGILTLLPYYVVVSSETGNVLTEGMIEK